jgi:hypothetical protein
VTDIDHEYVMVRLLTGTLAPGEREVVEDRLAADPAYFEAVCAFEDEMIRDWHRGELAGEERQMFANAYLASSARRARIASGRLLIDTIEDWTRADEQHASWWTRVREWLAAPRQVPQFSLAVAALLFVAALPLALHEMRNRAQAPSVSVVFPLSPVAERGDAVAHANDVRIPRHAPDVELRFEIPDPGDVTRVDATLEPLDRTAASTTYPVRLERNANLVLVTVTLAPGNLLDGDYVIKLRRTRTDGLFDIVATRTFRVVHQ